MEAEEGKSLVETPTWAVASVVSVMVLVGFFINAALEHIEKWLYRTKRKALIAALDKIKEGFFAIALAMIKIYSWRIWENQAKSMAHPGPQGMTRLSTFIYRNTAHPWSQHNILVWLLCFSRQIWSSINRADYRALRLGFITTHNLPLSYDFHNYMLRSMEEEFRDVVGISIPLWIFAISCILLGFHGTYIYFWLSFLPAIFIVLVGTKLHRIVIKLAVETKNTSQSQRQRTGIHQINLRDELFWFGRPRLLLQLIQFISFQNAFEMATCLWSLWEVNETSCFTRSHSVLVIRLTFGIISQFWCSFITFPLYVIVTQMGSRFKKTIVSEHVRESLHTWRRRVKAKHEHSPTFTLLPATSSTMSLESMEDDDHDELVPISSPHAFIEQSQSQVLKVSTDDKNGHFVPIKPIFTLLPAPSSTMSLDSMVDDDHDEIVPISSPHAFMEESQSQVLEVSTHDEKVHVVPVRPDDDEKDISCTCVRN